MKAAKSKAMTKAAPATTTSAVKRPTMNKISKTVSRNVHVLRAENHLKVSTFADMTGLAESTVRRAERAYKLRRPYNPKLTTLVKLSQATGATLDQMATEFLSPVN